MHILSTVDFLNDPAGLSLQTRDRLPLCELYQFLYCSPFLLVFFVFGSAHSKYSTSYRCHTFLTSNCRTFYPHDAVLAWY